MKIKNLTLWRTDHLKAILQRAAELELDPAKRKVLTVTVSYTRGGHSSGCAVIGGRHATVRIRHPHSRRRQWVHVPHDDPRPARGGWTEADGTSGKVVWDTSPRPLTPEEHAKVVLAVASVAAHEFAHIRGMNHQVMPAKYKWHGRWEEYVQWATGMPLDVTAPKAVVKPTAHDKLEHVLKMKARAETRVKRATTLLKKWKARERYYQKAAQKAAQTAQ